MGVAQLCATDVIGIGWTIGRLALDRADDSVTFDQYPTFFGPLLYCSIEAVPQVFSFCRPGGGSPQFFLSCLGARY